MWRQNCIMRTLTDIMIWLWSATKTAAWNNMGAIIPLTRSIYDFCCHYYKWICYGENVWLGDIFVCFNIFPFYSCLRSQDFSWLRDKWPCCNPLKKISTRKKFTVQLVTSYFLARSSCAAEIHTRVTWFLSFAVFLTAIVLKKVSTKGGHILASCTGILSCQAYEYAAE